MTLAVEPWLTRDASKRAQYADDPYFWEGWASFQARRGARPADATLRHLTFLLVKPEAIVGRRVAPILGFLRARGYRVIGTWPVRMGRHEVRCLWRYQLNVVPIAHIRALEMVLTAGEVFLVGLGYPGEAGAAEALNRDKGCALRRLLGCPAVMINFVHAPDEPADVLRELAVLCDARLLEQVIATLLSAGGWPAARFAAAGRAAAAVMTSRYERSAAHDLDVTATLRRMRARLHDAPAAGLPPATRAAIELGRTTPERALEVVASLESNETLPKWDRIVTAACLADGLRTGHPPLIGPAG